MQRKTHGEVFYVLFPMNERLVLRKQNHLQRAGLYGRSEINFKDLLYLFFIKDIDLIDNETPHFMIKI